MKTASSKESISILLADDHLVVRQGLAAILSTEIHFSIVAEADDGWRACELFAKHQPDVLILDLRMPVLNGFDVVRRLVKEYTSPNILVVTTYDTDEDIWRCLRAGAKGYLLKDATAEQIVAAVRTVARGQSFTTPEIAVKLARRASASELTDREAEVLRLMAEGQTNKDIARNLCVEEGTIKTHLKAIFQKLDADTRTQAVYKATERGLLRSNQENLS